MRDFKSMKRQRSRNRGGGGGGGKPQHNVNRAFDSNGPDGVKIRGHAQHVFEKYQQLARDAASSGDRVLAENYLQHAEHYFRVLRAVQPQRPAAEIIGRDAFTSGIDIDFEDESVAEATEAPESAEASEEGGEAPAQGGGQGQNGRQDYRPEGREGRGDYQGGRRDYRDDRGFRDGRRDERGDRGDRYEGRRDERGDRFEGQGRGDRFEGQGRGDQGRGDQGRYEGRRDERGYGRDDRRRDDRGYRDDRRDRYEPRGERGERYGDRPNERASGSDPLAVVEPESTPLTPERPAEVSPTLRSEDGGFSPAPAFLQPRAEAGAEEGEAPAEPRRRRGRPRREAEPASSAGDEG
jgi:hypothetical protein